MSYWNSGDFLLTKHVQEECSESRRNSVCEFCGNEVCVCKFCGNEVSLESNSFCCRDCRSHYHKDCLTITNPKIHEHTLTFIHKNNAFGCDACGSVNENEVNMFGCLPCNFFIHRKCIFLPRIIKITHHSHYLSHTLCIPDGKLRCRICRNNENKLIIGYGGYICNEKACDYVAHSSCATMREVWDGRDVEGEPKEESDSEADLAALVEISGRSIRHVSHDHDLMRFEVDHEEESGQVCQACILPIQFGHFLGCKQCDFALHDACARLPRKMENALHRHPLILRVNMLNIEEDSLLVLLVTENHVDSCINVAETIVGSK